MCRVRSHPARLFILGLAVVAAGCAHDPAIGAPVTPASSGLTASAADVKITQLSGRASARVGQTIGVSAPGGEWQVDFDGDRLQLLTPTEKLSSPGAAGWVWRVIAPGNVDITFTSVVRCAQPPCPPAAAQFILSLELRSSASFPPGGRP